VPRIADAFGHIAAGALVAMPGLAEYLAHPEAMGPEEANALSELLARRAGQVRSRERYDEVCVETTVQTTIDDERGPAAFECLGLDCGERYVYGVSPDGRTLLVQEEPAAVYVPFATSPAPRNAEVLERLLLVHLDGDAPREEEVAVADNFFGYGSMTDDLSRIAFVEQGSGRFGVVVVEPSSGERRVLKVRERPTMILQARLSPDGAWVAFHEKAFARAHTELHVIPADGGEERIISRRTRVGHWVVAPLRPGEPAKQLLAFDGTESYAGSPTPALVDPESPEDVVELELGDYVVRQVAGSHEGRIILIGSQRATIDTCEVGIRDPQSGEITWQALSVCVEDARVSAAGELTAAAVVSDEGDPEGEDAEAIAMDLASGETTIHTRNRLRERYVRVAGERVFFERVVPSQFPAVHPNAVCWTNREAETP
jgi:hypothetical protein